VLRVPEVYAQAEATSDCPAFLLMEWIESRTGTDRNKAGAALGYRLALLHRQTSGEYGLDYDNYCGASVQLNGWYASWLDFFRERRLGAQTQMAQAAGLLPPERGRKLARLLDVLDTWIDDRPEPPSLLHGDLWSGNWLIDGDGEPVLIDPAVYYGHREAELAMCRLFGGFPPDFFAAYDAVCAPLPGRDERLPLYQLYHLLNHLNLYGESYGRQVDQILLRYVG
jgi:fructosamine-3-kinase